MRSRRPRVAKTRARSAIWGHLRVGSCLVLLVPPGTIVTPLHCCSLFLCYCGPGRNFQCDRIGSCVPAPDMSSISTSCCAWPSFTVPRLLRAFLLNAIKRNQAHERLPPTATATPRVRLAAPHTQPTTTAATRSRGRRRRDARRCRRSRRRRRWPSSGSAVCGSARAPTARSRTAMLADEWKRRRALQSATLVVKAQG